MSVYPMESELHDRGPYGQIMLEIDRIRALYRCRGVVGYGSADMRGKLCADIAARFGMMQQPLVDVVAMLDRVLSYQQCRIVWLPPGGEVTAVGSEPDPGWPCGWKTRTIHHMPVGLILFAAPDDMQVPVVIVQDQDYIG